MEYQKEMTLKSGAGILVRSLSARDAQAALWTMHRCMGESLNLARYPDEMRFTVSQEAEFIESHRMNPRGALLGVFLGEELVGVCSAQAAGPNERYRHRAGVGIMILKAYWGKGIGSAMMDALIEAMKETEVEQLELDAVSTNAAALALYKKAGFVQYGLLERGMKYRDGSYADLVLMKLQLAKPE